jgi:peptide/nickel transport system substrate-binding protein
MRVSTRRRARILPLILALLILGALAAIFLRGGGPDGEREVPAALPPKGELAVAYPDEPLSLNPYTFEGDANSTRDLLRPIMPTLLKIEPDMTYKPSLATRVPSGSDIQQDPFSLTFRLRRDAVWSDGTPITSGDVRFTWETIRNPNFPIAMRSPYDRITDVVANDQRTVTIIFDGPYPAWRDVFSAGDFVLPKHLLEGKDFAAELRGGLPASGGPYMLESWERGLRVVYVANPKWWGGGPRLARVTVFFVPSFETTQNLLENGRVDALVTSSRISTKRRIEQGGGWTSKSSLGAAWWELGINAASPKVTQANRRRAIFHAVDRAGINEAAVRSDGRPLQHLMPGRDEENVFSRFNHDAQKSQELKGSDDLGTLAISTAARNEIGIALQRAVQVGLKNAGITAEVANPEADRFYGDWLGRGTWDLALVERRGTPSTLLQRFHSGYVPPRGNNYYRLNSSSVDQAINISERSRSFDKESTQSAMEALADEAVVLPMFEARMYAGFRRGLLGVEPNATIDGPFWNLEDWSQ